MKTSPEPSVNPLLNSVLAGSELTEFRTATLDFAVGLARRRRKTRARNRVVAAAMIPLLLAIVGTQWFRRSAPQTRPATFTAVRTAPLRSEVRVTTQIGSYATVRSDSAVFAVVTTDPARPGYRALTDDGLLALFRDRPVGLITDLEGQRHLVFLDADGPSSPGE